MKKNLIKTLSALILFTSLPVLLNAQNARLKYANKMYAAASYYYASEAYEDVIDRKVDSNVVATRIADSYDKIGNTQKALEWYRYLNRNKQLTQSQHLRMALLERQVENYEQSDALMADYSSKYGNLSNSNTSKTSVQQLRTANDQFSLINQQVNTASSDMGVSYLGSDQVLFASATRRVKAAKQLHGWTGTYMYDMYLAPIKNDGTIQKKKLMKSQAKTKFNDGPAAYNQKLGYVYFTRNNFVNGKKIANKNNIVGLKIFRAKLDGRKLVDLEELSINSNEYSSAHPTLSSDGKRLYFSSDRPGGFGGMDVYYVELDNNGLPIGTPINLGNKINTAQHEIFPSFNNAENLLFFSSEGHYGLGGLDVFVAKLHGTNNIKSVENVGAPINSPNDDFSFITNENQTMGYFSSNRNGGKGHDDIYGFNQKYIIRNSALLKGTVVDELTNEPIINSTIYLLDKNGTTVDSTKTNKEGDFEMSLGQIENNFKLVADKTGYVKTDKRVIYDPTLVQYEEDLKLFQELDYYIAGLVTDKATGLPIEGVKVTITDLRTNEKSSEFNTLNSGTFETQTIPYKYNDYINYEIKLEHPNYVGKTLTYNEALAKKQEINVNEKMKLNLVKIVVGQTDLNDVVEINPIYFDFDKAEIRPDAAVELDKVVKIMKENPSLVIELGSHTDSRGSDNYNRTLSDKRAKASANYIISKGISKDRISGKGYGKSRLKISDKLINAVESEEEKEALHQKNRRTEFIVVKLK